jgi:hypothetical protein
VDVSDCRRNFQRTSEFPSIFISFAVEVHLGKTNKKKTAPTK